MSHFDKRGLVLQHFGRPVVRGRDSLTDIFAMIPNQCTPLTIGTRCKKAETLSGANVRKLGFAGEGCQSPSNLPHGERKLPPNTSTSTTHRASRAPSCFK